MKLNDPLDEIAAQLRGQTCTVDANGKLLTVEQEGVSMPANYSFQCVNDYVHDDGRHFEELQSLALGMANEIDRLEKERAEQWRIGRELEADRDTANAVAAELRAELALSNECLDMANKNYAALKDHPSDDIAILLDLAKRLTVPMLRTSEYLFDHRDALDELRALLAQSQESNHG